MSNQRIEFAKKALIIFLKSLPTNIFFNIFAFGSEFSPLFDISIKYTESNVNNAINKV